MKSINSCRWNWHRWKYSSYNYNVRKYLWRKCQKCGKREAFSMFYGRWIDEGYDKIEK